jgi:hypothetical protein
VPEATKAFSPEGVVYSVKIMVAFHCFGREVLCFDRETLRLLRSCFSETSGTGGGENGRRSSNSLIVDTSLGMLARAYGVDDSIIGSAF